MMLGFLLARAGVGVVVLEKHADFLRDFRGDTIHPSTLEIMHELGLLEAFLRLPHQELRTLAGLVGDTRVTLADFTHLPTRCKFVALMPQWDFLNFMAERAKTYPAFKLMMRAEAMDLFLAASGSRAAAFRRPMVSSTSAQKSPSARMAGIPRCAPAPISRSRISARPWTCCG